MLICEGGFIQGIVLTTIGFMPKLHIHSLIAAVAVAAIFTEAGNGANFAVVPHVHPASNGIVSGLTGASGNLGGIVFALIFRFNGTNYHKSYWIIGIISTALSLCMSWIRVPRVSSLSIAAADGAPSSQVKSDGWANRGLDICRGDLRSHPLVSIKLQLGNVFKRIYISKSIQE